VQVLLQVHATQRQVPDALHGGDVVHGEDASGALDGADERFAGRPLRHPADVIGRLGLRNPDAVFGRGDGVEVGRAPLRMGGIDPHPRPVLRQDLGDQPARGLLCSGGTASSRSSMTASAPAWNTLASSFSLCPGANR
jgi:hypothetical protein